MTWPIENVIRIISSSKSYLDKYSNESLETQTLTHQWISELLIRYLRLITYIAVSFFAYYWNPYGLPSVDPLVLFAQNPIAMTFVVIIRNLVIGLGFAGFWHWFLYDSKWGGRHNPNVGKLKFNPIDQYLPSRQTCSRGVTFGRPKVTPFRGRPQSTNIYQKHTNNQYT